MGLLALGTPLDWPDAKKVAGQVRTWGIEQLLAIWRNAKGKERDALLWGDEIEYLVVCYDQDNHKVRLSLRQADILAALANDEKLLQQGGGVPDLQTGDADAKDNPAPVFHPEFGRFMLEATPGKPWGIGFKDLLDVEPNMKWRRTIAKDHMAQTEFPITLTTFPRLGSADCIVPPYPVSGPKLRSQFVPDEIANPHIRFPTLAANIRWRRGRKVQVNVPVFKDKNTPWPWKDPTVNYDMHNWPEDDDVRNGAVKDNYIHMDAMAFGMGSCCLQITFQAKNIEEGRTMYDQLSPIAPILLALTAATPIYKGFLADTDVRWNQISRSVDDRTPEELGEKPLKNDRWRLPKSRYASNSTYISQDPRLRPEYLDPDLIIDADIKQRLVEGGMDDLLATHFAHLFIRDPIVVFAEDLQELDLTKADHFENLQSTNWQHMRFKPPPAGSDMGWRVEFRPMEIQITDFENAAFSIFIVLLTRAILSFNLNFYIPITLVSENMETAHIRDAVSTQKFWFRKNPFSTHKPGGTGTSTPVRNGSRPATPTGPVEDEYAIRAPVSRPPLASFSIAPRPTPKHYFDLPTFVHLPQNDIMSTRKRKNEEEELVALPSDESEEEEEYAESEGSNFNSDDSDAEEPPPKKKTKRTKPKDDEDDDDEEEEDDVSDDDGDDDDAVPEEDDDDDEDANPKAKKPAGAEKDRKVKKTGKGDPVPVVDDDDDDDDE